MAEAPDGGINIKNDTTQTVRISYVVAGVERSDARDVQGDTLVSGQSHVFYLDLYAVVTPSPSPGSIPRRCTRGDIVVRTLDGTLIGRIPPPVCEWGLLLISKDTVTPGPS